MPKRTGGTNRTCQGNGKLSKDGGGAFGEIEIDVASCYFTSTRVRPVFACGRRLDETLQQILNKPLDIKVLPVMQVVFGKEKDSNGDLCFFGLNNRRLWIYKQLCNEGLLQTITVHAREMKGSEAKKYTTHRCRCQAKLERERPIKMVQWSPSNHHQTPIEMQMTAHTVLLIGVRLQRLEKESQSQCRSAESELHQLRIPALPVEMWYSILECVSIVQLPGRPGRSPPKMHGAAPDLFLDDAATSRSSKSKGCKAHGKSKS